VTLENANVFQKSICAHQGRANDDSHRREANGKRKCKSMTGFHLETPFYIVTRKYSGMRYYKKHAIHRGHWVLLRIVLKIKGLRSSGERFRMSSVKGFMVSGKAMGASPFSK
jgi:hypothetical protein